MEYTKCKCEILVKLNILNKEIIDEYVMSKLLTRKKKDQNNCILPALQVLDIDESDHSDSGGNNDFTEGCSAAPYAI